MSQLLCTDDSRKSVEYLEKHLDGFAPVKRFTSFFDSENFLLTNYHVSAQSVHTVIENFCGDTIEFTGLICGYAGEGPQYTAEALVLLGIDEDEAKRLVLNNAMRIEFNGEDAQAQYSLNTDFFFNGRVRHRQFGGINIGEYCMCNVIQREIYLVNPELHCFNGLLDCLHVMKPALFEYTIGKNEYIVKCDDIPEFINPLKSRQYPQGASGVNLIIRGEMFDLKCFIDVRFLRGTLNAIYLYLMKTPLFEETDTNSAVVGTLAGATMGSLGSVLGTVIGSGIGAVAGYRLGSGIIRHARSLKGASGDSSHQTLPVSDEELKKDAD